MAMEHLRKAVLQRHEAALKARASKLRAMLEHLISSLSREELERVYLFGSFAWGWLYPHSDLDVAIYDLDLTGDEAWKLFCKVFDCLEDKVHLFETPEEFEDAFDVVLLSEVPETLRNRILKEGLKLSEYRKHREP